MLVLIIEKLKTTQQGKRIEKQYKLEIKIISEVGVLLDFVGSDGTLDRTDVTNGSTGTVGPVGTVDVGNVDVVGVDD